MGGGLAGWAAASRAIDQVQQPVIEAALLAAELATHRDPNDTDAALSAIEAGLRVCPTDEALPP